MLVGASSPKLVEFGPRLRIHPLLDGDERPNGQVCEITEQLDLRAWPAGSRVIVRRERPHPGAQLTFTDHDGYPFQATPTDQTDEDIVEIARRHGALAGVEDHIRNDKDTGLQNLPFRDFEHNRIRLQWYCSPTTSSPGPSAYC